MLERRDIQPRPRLARRLLRWAGKIVHNTALYGFIIYCIGCVIPTPLDRAPAPTNYSPVFVADRVNPKFGPMTAQINALTEFNLAATDPNTADTLTVRLFVPDLTQPNGFIYTGFNTTLSLPSTPDPTDPNLRLGTLEAGVCLNHMPGDKFDLYAVVADRPFTGNTNKAEGGLTDTNHWELSCTSM